MKSSTAAKHFVNLKFLVHAEEWMQRTWSRRSSIKDEISSILQIVVACLAYARDVMRVVVLVGLGKTQSRSLHGSVCTSVLPGPPVGENARLPLFQGLPNGKPRSMADSGRRYAFSTLLSLEPAIAAAAGTALSARRPERVGWLAGFVGLDMLASSEWTRQALDWHPNGPGLLDDLKRMDYSAAR